MDAVVVPAYYAARVAAAEDASGYGHGTVGRMSSTNGFQLLIEQAHLLYRVQTIAEFQLLSKDRKLRLRV